MANKLNASLQLIYDGIADGISSLTESLSKKDPHSASFGRPSEIGGVLKSGVQISKHVKLSLADSSNILITGVPGSGKTSSYIIPNIFEAKRMSFCIHDPSGDIYAATSGILSRRCDIKVLNFSSRESSAYNPVARIRVISDLYRLCDSLVRLTIDRNTNDPFWAIQARQILATLMILLFYFPPKYRNLINLNQLVKILSSGDAEKIDRWVVQTNDRQLITDYKSIIGMPERTLSNCLASVKSVLSFVEDPQIARVTSFDTLNIQNIRRRPTALYLRNSIGSLKYVSILNGIYFEQYFSGLIKKLPSPTDLPLFNVIDEAASGMYISGLSTFLAHSRKYKIINMLAIQARHQLTSVYKEEAQDILSCCVTKIYLPGITEMQTLQEIEALSGQTTFIDKKGNKSVRHLITAQEIMTLGKNEALILSGRNRLIKARTLPYYQNLKYREFIKMRPYQMRTDIPRQTIPLLH